MGIRIRKAPRQSARLKPHQPHTRGESRRRRHAWCTGAGSGGLTHRGDPPDLPHGGLPGPGHFALEARLP